MASDPWTAFLDWLSTVLVPAWGELIALLPFFVLLLIVGPILTLVVLMWAYYVLTRRRGRVRRAEAEAVSAARDDDGAAVFPANVPYCEEHALIYPPRATRCGVDGADLAVACPVDGTLRDAAIETCAACGTTFKLGATSRTLTVTSANGPPEGGAAIA